MFRNGNPVGTVTWVWTPPCGAMHIEENPPSVPLFVCPDGLPDGWADQEQRRTRR